MLPDYMYKPGILVV